jgi:hypothetical protein
MDVRILDLDGAHQNQSELRSRYRPECVPMSDWGPRIRLACSLSRFRSFEEALAHRLGDASRPALTFYGSGDFHHVSLALVRRLQQPFNLLVLDNHPDWMRGVPFLHCGTWLYHAARLPNVRRIFHVGGDVDFDNYYRPLAPWKLLREGKIVVFPAFRTYRAGGWASVENAPVRQVPEAPLRPSHLRDLLIPFREELRQVPLYISLDKDVMIAADAVVNWDSGCLTLGEVREILGCFLEAARGDLAGMDVLGEWSPVQVAGLFRYFFHLTMHPSPRIDAGEANRVNERTNLAVLETVLDRERQHHRQVG